MVNVNDWNNSQKMKVQMFLYWQWFVYVSLHPIRNTTQKKPSKRLQDIGKSKQQWIKAWWTRPIVWCIDIPRRKRSMLLLWGSNREKLNIHSILLIHSLLWLLLFLMCSPRSILITITTPAIPYITWLRASRPRSNRKTLRDTLIWCFNCFSHPLPWLPQCYLLLRQRTSCRLWSLQQFPSILNIWR